MNRTVVVVGGGYGGSLVAKALDSEADVVLVDPWEAFVNAAASLRASPSSWMISSRPTRSWPAPSA